MIKQITEGHESISKSCCLETKQDKGTNNSRIYQIYISRELHVSQPTISRDIHYLEKELAKSKKNYRNCIDSILLSEENSRIYKITFYEKSEAS